MSENKIIKCAKCQKNAETDSRFRNEFAVNYPIRDKDKKIYCWDCYKGFSSCKGCGKSVANIKFPRSGQPQYPRCSGGVSYNCERISNNVEFICSKECSKKLADQRYQAWKDKLSQGWTKCKDCVKFWIDGESNEEGWEWLKEERQHSRFIKLLSPGQENEICDRCKPYAKDGYYHKISQKAQKYWDSLNKEEKLAAVIRTGGVSMAKFYGETKTAEQLAEQKEAPRSIYEEFVHSQKCGSCGEEPCQENQKNKNNPQMPPILANFGGEERKEELEKKTSRSQKAGCWQKRNREITNGTGKIK